MLAQLNEKAAQARTAALTPYINNDIAARTVVPGAGANSGFITSMVGGKLMVKNVKTGQVSEANDDQKAKYFATEKTRVDTAKAESTIGQQKVSPRTQVILAKSSNLPGLTADLKQSYSSGGLNTLSTAKTDAKRGEFAQAVSAITGEPAEVIEHNIKSPILNSSSAEIIDHYAAEAEKKRGYLEKNPGAIDTVGEAEDAGTGG